jgi:hypothetical protein
MTRAPKLASAAALAFVTAAADAPAQTPAPAADSIAVVGHRDGRAAAATRIVGGSGALGALTGFIAGAVGIPLLLFSHDEGRILGVAATIPVVLVVAGVGASPAPPPPDVGQRITNRPAAYQAAFRTGYAQRLAERRRRAAARAGLLGAVAGAATLLAVVLVGYSGN